MNENGLTEVDGMWEPAGTVEEAKWQGHLNSFENRSHDLCVNLKRTTVPGLTLMDTWKPAWP